MAISDRDLRVGLGKCSAEVGAPIKQSEFAELLDHLSNLADEIDNDLARLDDISHRVIGPRPEEASVNKLAAVASHTYVHRLRELVSRYEGLETRLRNSIGELSEAL